MKVLTLLIATTMLFSACGNSGDTDWGEKVSYLNLDVYYTDGVLETEAKAVGEKLYDIGFGMEREEVLQLSRSGDRYECRFVMPDGKVTVKTVWRNHGDFISKVLGGAPVDVVLCDKKLNTLHRMPDDGK